MQLFSAVAVVACFPHSAVPAEPVPATVPGGVNDPADERLGDDRFNGVLANIGDEGDDILPLFDPVF